MQRIDTTMLLGPEDVEAVARRTVELLQGDRPSAFRLVDARELADQLGVHPSFVYAHAKELGGLRLGTGRKARIRFEVDRAREVLDARRLSAEGRQRRNAAGER
jgi:hypothetical protein